MSQPKFTQDEAAKCFKSRYFEDYHVGDEIVHSVPRTITSGDAAVYMATTGSRFALHSSNEYARELGYPEAPIDDILAFHMVFGRTVPDLSLNAIANLGYAGCKFGVPVYVGDTVNAKSTVVGVKENSNGKTGTVYVHSRGWNQKGEVVLDYYRWLMMRKKNVDAPAPQAVLPDNLPDHVGVEELVVPDGLDLSRWNSEYTGSDAFFEDYEIGERIHHLDGQTIEEAEHQMATRLYQNNARVHFNQDMEKDGRFGRRIVYGGYIISLARAISCNGLANAFRVVAINSGRHAAPSFAGNTIYAWSEVLDKMDIAGRSDVAALRLRTIASKDEAQAAYPDKTSKDFPENIVLDLDYTVLIPKRG